MTSTYIEDAEAIWLDFKRRGSSDSKFLAMDIDERLDYYQRRYHNFAMTFPIVLRYMIQLNQYHKAAFTKYVKKMQNNPYRSEHEYCERQADYVKYLFMRLSPSHNAKEAQAVWQKTRDMLVEELEIFKRANEKVKQKLEKNNSQNSEERRKELKRMLSIET